MRMIVIASVITVALSGVAVPLATVQQQNNIVKGKKNCTPDACQKTVRQKGFPFATAASWCATHNNGC
jgi:hypothetical protein